MKAILGKKSGMTTFFDIEKGVATPVTLVKCAPNRITDVRTHDRDGYAAVQLEAAGAGRSTVRREFHIVANSDSSIALNTEITVDAFAVGDRVVVSGISKAKGYQGVVKRHGFSGSPKTHGHRHNERKPGSIGCRFPQHVQKGKRMAGRMGADRVTIRGLRVAFIDSEAHVLGISGPIPGVRGRIVEISVVPQRSQGDNMSA